MHFMQSAFKRLKGTIQNNNFELQELTSFKIALKSEIQKLQHTIQSNNSEL